MNKITYLDGVRLHRALVAGIRLVISREDYLNKINVFPVPDGDTGTNLAFTFSSVLEQTQFNVHSDLSQMLLIIADAAIDGARGNAGVIFAQFFQGLCDAAHGLSTIRTTEFAQLAQTGAEYARDALLEPREGTILTIVDDFADELSVQSQQGVDDFQLLIEKALQRIEESLANTPNQLVVLKKAGVVDAGAQGFVDLIRGIDRFTSEGSIREFTMVTERKLSEYERATDSVSEELEFQFCTECLITGDSIDRKQMREDLIPLGNSLVLAGSKNKARLHIHSNAPAEVFEICERYGMVSMQKADDMKHQHDSTTLGNQQVAIVTDSVADFPDSDDLDVHVVPVRFNFGTRGYIDKVSLTPGEFYHVLETSPDHPKTSQPTPGDFRRTYQFLYSHYQSILSIHLADVLSGTLQSAHYALKQLSSTAVTIIDSKTVSVSEGMLVLVAAEMAKAGKTLDEIVQRITELRTQVKLYAALENLHYAVRGGRVPKIVNTIARALHLKPVLSTKPNGRLAPVGVLFGKKHTARKLVGFILKKIDKNCRYRVIIGHTNCEDRAHRVKEIIREKLSRLRDIHIVEIGGGLGSHTGPGAVAVALLEVE